ncbi:putative RNA-directed DNA polymerase from transposon BS [Amphibalanus amphitrite]|uniref:Putative RNA-directed DNA polymerase from transposon BS n=1 Tax=Amphibalanus amphitrite TaxID=1232801 RepID=A0A6A4WVB5_AMPAM|nr:putative RNA-directed DNA polymerase from transposon BS [Amphibalanus amphitrite]
MSVRTGEEEEPPGWVRLHAVGDDSTEVCGVRILGKSPISIFNIYRPPIRRSPTDDREDNFDPAALPSDEDAIILGDLNAHHPLWDSGCDTADDVGNRVADWLDSVGWSPLNSGEPTHSSYRSGGSSAPDVAVCSRALARRSTWRVGPDLGSDHLPMLVSIRTTPRPEPSTRKPQWSFGKADWVAFKADCEATLLRAEPLHATAQELTTRFTEAIMSASRKYIPRGARKVVEPWALDPELQQAVAERREARRALRPGDPATRDRWVAAKRRAAETEKRVSQAHFRNFVETTLNKPASLGRVTKILKKWEGASDEHRPGQAMTEGDRLLVTDSEKAEAFNATYAHVSRQKYVLLAFDFARAYDTVDHRLLRVRLMELGIPRCFYAWTWQYLRDRRARVEFQSATSGERVYRAGLPQGSVLSPALFLLWAAPLAAELQKTPGTTAFLYADDTAALCSGNNIEVAKLRAQQAADALVKWARASKMVVAGQKTQALVLSQWARDAVNCSVQVAGETVVAGDQLKLLGITLDRLLHFGAHCRSLRQRVRPRTNQLRLLTGREWGLEERQLRIVASGYIRGALEHAAAAWLPAASPSHIMLLEREMREAARVVTGCPRSTPAHAVMAEAGLAPVAERRTALAARLLAKARALPAGDPLRKVAESQVPTRLSTVTGWRGVGEETWRAAGICPPIEPILPLPDPPWEPSPTVSFGLDIGAAIPTAASDTWKRNAASQHLAALPQCATWVWTDGSATDGVLNGGAGALIVWPDGEERSVRAPAGRLCSSFRAEMVALRTALSFLLENPLHADDPVVICTDSQSALAALREGPAAQYSPLGGAIWRALRGLTAGGRQVHLQWVPSHCGLEGNERADSIAKEASNLAQDQAPIDVQTAHRAAARVARARTIQAWPAGWFRRLTGDRLPPAVAGGDRSAAVDVHQLRAGHWTSSTQWRHRVGLAPSRLAGCEQCDDQHCRAALCPVCREEADTPQHVFLRCPALMATRHRLLGSINPDLEEVRSGAIVAALGAAHRSLQSRTATSQL